MLNKSYIQFAEKYKNKIHNVMVFLSFLFFSGGNQRELARQKNKKKQEDLKKKQAADNKDGNRGLTLEERRHRYNCFRMCSYFWVNYCFIFLIALVQLIFKKDILCKIVVA